MPRILDNVLESIGFNRSQTIGLALSGGGARGFAHVGVFMAFERFGIKPGIVSGVSAGSIAAVLYGAGLDPKQMLECFSAYNKLGSFTEWAIPKEGFLKLTKFSRMLESWLPVRYLEQFSTPTVICATDFDHGKSVGWAKGEIVPRVVASCSIPIVFQPVKINGVNYVDGGVLRNLPAWAIRKHCDTLIGSNCSPLNRKYKYKNSLLDIAIRSYQLMSKANTLQDLALCDHVIQAQAVAEYGTFNLTKINEVVNFGYEAACRTLEKLNR